MTPAVVTVAEIAEWAASPTLGKGSEQARLMASYERTLRLLAGLLPAVDCPWEEDGTCTPENCMKEEARVALKEAHRDA